MHYTLMDKYCMAHHSLDYCVMGHFCVIDMCCVMDMCCIMDLCFCVMETVLLFAASLKGNVVRTNVLVCVETFININNKVEIKIPKSFLEIEIHLIMKNYLTKINIQKTVFLNFPLHA